MSDTTRTPPLPELLQLSCSANALRWLVARGFAEHAVLTSRGKPSRRRTNPPAHDFPAGTCFILTEEGASLARELAEEAAGPRLAVPDVPVWYPLGGELRFRGRLVKRYQNTAENQRGVLDEFQKQGWPTWIADPLPHDPEVNGKQRLRLTVHHLNDNLQVQLLHFFVADSGGAIGWKPVGEVSALAEPT